MRQSRKARPWPEFHTLSNLANSSASVFTATTRNCTRTRALLPPVNSSTFPVPNCGCRTIEPARNFTPLPDEPEAREQGLSAPLVARTPSYGHPAANLLMKH